MNEKDFSFLQELSRGFDKHIHKPTLPLVETVDRLRAICMNFTDFIKNSKPTRILGRETRYPDTDRKEEWVRIK